MKTLELKTTITKIINSLDGLSNRLKIAEVSISKLENRLIELSSLNNRKKIKEKLAETQRLIG